MIGFSRTAQRARLRRRAAVGDRRRRRHAGLRLQRRRCCASATARIDAAFGGYPHALHYALKANSTLALARLLRELGSAADANSIWEIELARAGRLRARRHRLHRRRQVAGRARMRRAARPEGDQRRVGRRARAHRGDRARGSGCVGARRDPRQPRHRREEPSAHLDGPEDQQVRRAARRCARAARVDRPRRPVAQARRRPRARRLADHDARAAARAPRRSSPGCAGELRRAGHRARVRRSRRRPRHLLRRRRRSPSADEYVAGARRRRARRRGLPIVIEPGRVDRRAGRRAGRARRRPEAAQRRPASSPSSTPA